MTTKLRDLMVTRADAAPGPHIDIDAVIRAGRRRVRWHRAAAVTAAGAALVAVILIVPMLAFVGGDDNPSFSSDGFGRRQISYASGSTIHYGDRSIDVSPHEVASYVLTDDGFVYTTRDGAVYFTDGGDSEPIGHAGGDNTLVADDTGSYVGWVEIGADSDPSAIVYDTSRGAEVLRMPNIGGSTSSCYSDGRGATLVAIDGDTAYFCHPNGLSSQGLTTDSDRYVSPAQSGLLRVTDVADGAAAWADPEGPAIGRGTIVSRGQRARTQSRQVSATQLSPGAEYLAGYMLTDNGDWRTLIVDRTSNWEVELDMPAYQEWYVMQWIGDDRFTAVGFDVEDYEGAAADVPELLTCDISAMDCTVVGRAMGSDIVQPTGLTYW
jgi:hypothetical protein